MGELVSLSRDEVTPEDVVDALSGYIKKKDIEKVIAICEDVDGNLAIVLTDMTNTELVGTLQIAVMNYIHGFQHED